MKKNIALLLSLTLGLTAVCCALPAAETRAETSKELIVLETPTGSEEMDTTGTEAVTMYRLYNPNSGEHFYTGSETEKAGLVKEGWNDEGIGWIAPVTSKTPVYRLYNANAGDHHYTMNEKERDGLIVADWKDEGIGWYSDDEKTVPLFREYNPNAVSGTHNYTIDKLEHYDLVKAGWNDEGIGWYGIKEKKTDALFPDAKVGDYVTFGTYEQDNNLTNGAEPIEWQYIADRDGHKLLLSKYALDSRAYHDKDEGVTWENCALRKWLNEDFYDTAFSADDKKKIVTAHNENPDTWDYYKIWNTEKHIWGAEGGNATDDKIFLLSVAEAAGYLDGEVPLDEFDSSTYDPTLMCRPTRHCFAQGVMIYSTSWGLAFPSDVEGCCRWFLRSPGEAQVRAMEVKPWGAIGSNHILASQTGIRPAILID